jgi:hypothetical protein
MNNKRKKKKRRAEKKKKKGRRSKDLILGSKLLKRTVTLAR